MCIRDRCKAKNRLVLEKGRVCSPAKVFGHLNRNMVWKLLLYIMENINGFITLNKKLYY